MIQLVLQIIKDHLGPQYESSVSMIQKVSKSVLISSRFVLRLICISCVSTCVSVGASDDKEEQNLTLDSVLIPVLTTVGITSCLLIAIIFLLRYYKFINLMRYPASALHDPQPASNIGPVQRGRLFSSNSFSSYPADDLSLGVSECTDEFSPDETSSDTTSVFDRIRTV
jgi:hypothetical protein